MKKLLPLTTILIFTIMVAFPQSSDLISEYRAKAKSAVEDSDFTTAVSYYEKLIELQIQAYGEKSAELATIYNDLGEVYYNNLGDYDRALEYCEKALDIRLKLFGENHADVAKSYTYIGWVYEDKCDYDRALEYYEKSLKIRLNISGENHLDTATVYNNIGWVYERKCDYDRALSYYGKALDIQLKLFGENHTDVAESYSNIANVYDEKCDYDRALEYYEKALKMRLNISGENHLDTAFSYYNIGRVYKEKCDYDRALSYYGKALDIQLKLFGENHTDVAESYSNIANVYDEKCDYDRALEYYEKALKIQLNVLGENNLEAAWSYQNIGWVYEEKCDYDRALSYFGKALDIRLKLFGENHADVAKIYTYIGWVYGEKCDYDRALSYFGKALDIQLKLFGENHADVAKSYTYIGWVYEKKCDYDRALSYYGKALDIRLKLFGENHTDVAASYTIIATVYYNKCEHDRALEYYEKALKIQLNVFGENHLDTAWSYQNIGWVYEKKCEYDRALEYYEKALKIQLNVFGENHADTATVYNHIGYVYYCKNDIKSAISYNQKAYKGWKNTSGNYGSIITSLTDIAFMNLPSTSFTRETLALATDIVERARQDLFSMKDDIMRQSLPIYYYGVQFEAEQKNPKKAFEYSESLRSRGFLDQLGTETALKLDGISEEEKTQVQELTAKITSSRKIIETQNNKTLDERDEKLLSQAGTELTNAEKSLLKIDKKIGKRIPAYAQLRNPKPVSVNEAQKWCGKKRTVLEYVLWNPELTDKKDVKIKSYCIVLSNKKVNVVELDGDYDYTAAINKLRKGITDLKRESQFETVRNELYEKLISPVLSHIPGGTKELVVVPDGNLSFLPFDILRKDGDSKCLGDKYAVALSPSVSVSVLSGKKKASEKKMLAFGGAWYDTKLSADGHRANFTEEGISRGAKRGTYQVGFDAGDINEKLFSYMKNDIAQNGPKSYFAEKKLVWQDLPGTITELNALKDGIFKAGMFSEITQETASEKKVKELSKEGELLKFPILHFACHGYFDSRIAEMSSVLFSEVSGAAETDSEEDGYLTISETAVLNLNADLVCLSACETGLGEMKAGDGMVGLTRAFMVAGAEQVGASLWCVDDEATAKFMSGMYEKVVKKGLDYVTAYQKTKAEFRRDKDFSHPYYWSAFVLYE